MNATAPKPGGALRKAAALAVLANIADQPDEVVAPIASALHYWVGCRRLPDGAPLPYAFVVVAGRPCSAWDETDLGRLRAEFAAAGVAHTVVPFDAVLEDRIENGAYAYLGASGAGRAAIDADDSARHEPSAAERAATTGRWT